jgi:hypothetical protein
MSVILTSWDSSTNQDVFKTLVRKEFDSTDRTAVVESSRLYNMLTTKDLYERTMRYAGLPTGTEVGEGEEIEIFSPKFGQTKDYTVKQYGLGFRYSWLFKKTEKWNLLKKWSRNLALKQKELKDIELAKLWNSPTATYTGYVSGKYLGSATHTCLDDAASTYDNLLSAALSVTALQSAKYYFDKMKDDQGATFFLTPDLLYYEPTLDPTVQEILKSSGKPHELSNTTNIWQGKYEPYMYRRLSSTTAWGLLATKSDLYDVNCFTLAEPDADTAPAPNNSRDTIITSLQAFSSGFGDARAVEIGNT